MHQMQIRVRGDRVLAGDFKGDLLEDLACVDSGIHQVHRGADPLGVLLADQGLDIPLEATLPVPPRVRFVTPLALYSYSRAVKLLRPTDELRLRENTYPFAIDGATSIT